jgi:hypothetical protein
MRGAFPRRSDGKRIGVYMPIESVAGVPYKLVPATFRVLREEVAGRGADVLRRSVTVEAGARSSRAPPAS